MIGILGFSGNAIAQKDQSVTDIFNIHLNVKNMHLWHGFVVTPGVMLASSIEYKSADDKFIAGLWGGASFNGSYKEFSYYTKYNFTKSFNVSLISHNNYSNSDTIDIFSYDKETSPNFVDIVLEYTPSNDIPLTLYWSTILFGNAQDYETGIDGTLTDSYSTYVEVRHKLLHKKETKLTAFAGGAFSLVTDKTFYSEDAAFTNFGLLLNKDIKLFSQKIPVAATAMWNLETKVGALQIDIALF
ncbi:hypothetical protein R9C00_07200 [Flammeovirgaceae bacterium SG7u.111]|nr:hypothetical protein [Flammeovirgaceae bacterium SG7u.132]WPO37231.1 hypothetical protein R9C00_07200 [Flammeovirgaceae bacterium SG7u.111]